MGPTADQITRVRSIGYSAWLDEQFAQATTTSRWDWLVGAGFSTTVIYKILRQWDVPDESLAALENLGEDPHEE